MCFQLVCKTNEVGVGEIDPAIAVLAEALFCRNGVLRKPIGNVENSCIHIFEDCFGSAREPPQ